MICRHEREIGEIESAGGRRIISFGVSTRGAENFRHNGVLIARSNGIVKIGSGENLLVDVIANIESRGSIFSGRVGQSGIIGRITAGRGTRGCGSADDFGQTESFSFGVNRTHSSSERAGGVEQIVMKSNQQLIGSWR